MQEQIKQNNFMGQNTEEVSFFLKSTKEILGHVQVVMKSGSKSRVWVNFGLQSLGFYRVITIASSYPRIFTTL